MKQPFQIAPSWKSRVLFGFFFSSLTLFSQSTGFRFDQLTIDDGLSQNLVYTIEQDYRGFLWFGTNYGLNRYDGYEFKVYNHLPGDSSSLIDNAVTVVYEDSRRNLWVGAGGLHRYDRKRDRFERVLLAKDLPGSLATLQVNDIQEDHRGDLWISLRNAGLFHLERPGRSPPAKKGQLLGSGYRLVGPYLPRPGEGFAKGSEIFQVRAANHALWATHELGVFRLPAGADGRFPDPESAVLEPLPLELPGKEIQFRSLFQGPDSSLWISTSQGLIQLADPGRPANMAFYPYPEGAFSTFWEGIAKRIAMDPAGKLWLATYYGVMIFDPSSGKYRHIVHDPEEPQSLNFNNIADVFMDEGKVMWLGTVGMGLNKFNFNSKPFQNYLGRRQNRPVYSVYGILTGPEGKVWVVANTGDLIAVDRETGSVRAAPPGKLKDWSITGLVKDRNGLFWLTNDHLLVRFDPRSGSLDDFKIMPPLPLTFPSDSVSALLIDPEDRLWICNTRDLRRFDPASGAFEKYPLPNLYLEKIEALHRDANGDFWIGTLQGLLHFQLASGQWRLFRAAPGHPDSLQQNRVKSILPDPARPERYLWLGTGGGGLHRLDMEKGVFLAYTKKDGLANDFIYGILADASGGLWMSTNHGLSCFDPKTVEFTNYNVEDGLQSNEFNSRAFYRSENGELFFGGINGITAFFPDRIRPNPHVPPVVLVDLQLSYESVAHGQPGAPLKYSITETDEVFLTHQQNNVAFEFAALDFNQPDNNRYRYMLEGFDEGWIDAGASRRATYTNLLPGDYVFRVRGANNDGIWNEEGAAVRVVISPPFWKTWWAYLFYVLGSGLTAFLIARYLLERRKMGEELRIKALEARQLAELDQFKSQFFANISHEFRTPIALIQGRIEELLAELKRKDLKEKLFSMKKNSQQLLRLIEQLLDIARLEASKISLKRKPGDLVQFARLLTNSLKSSAESKGLSLSFSADADHFYTAFDRDAMQKILQNLISNAIKFTPAGGAVKLKVSVSVPPSSSLSGGERTVRIQVSDNGIGIPAEDLPHIFERFYQSAHAGGAMEKGFGLGMALTKELVTLHHGAISVESREGQGASFTVDLPFAPLESGMAGPGATPKTAIDKQLLELEVAELKSGVEARPDKMAPFTHGEEWLSNLVLVVEDHAELRGYITGILQREYKVIEAKDGQEGLDLALAQIPDLIISDVLMPRMDGYAMCRQLKADQRTSHIPLIMLTAKAEMEDRLKGLETGVDDYLVKPFNGEELKTRIRNLIRTREALKKKYSQSLLAGIAAGDSLEEQFLKKIRTFIEKNLEDENFSVEKLAGEVHMSSSQLYRKLRALTELSPVQLIQRFRLERAAVLLQHGHNVTEVAYRVGLRSPAYFSQLFKKHFGCSPREFMGT